MLIRLVPVLAPNPGLSLEGLPSAKGELMSRNALYAKFVLLVLVLGTLAMFLGSEPWGPN
jgi:hypothetical protein